MHLSHRIFLTSWRASDLAVILAVAKDNGAERTMVQGNHEAEPVDELHDALELRVDLFAGPGHAQ